MINYKKENKKIIKLTENNALLQSKCDALANDYSKIKTVLQSTMHEVRRFSGELSHYAEELSKNTSQSDLSHTRELAETIFYKLPATS